ncbi:hypothetical protein BBJ28_00018512 [Nothophytophthora sp. Chile5]|nr:hypothetical protein BBJ28_00018512 [Nothophytophthora sp. Chile5]
MRVQIETKVHDAAEWNDLLGMQKRPKKRKRTYQSHKVRLHLRSQASIAQIQQLQIAKAQAMLSRTPIDQQSYPLYTRINLTKDWGERRATLMEVREKKLRDAYEFIMAPGRFPNAEMTRHSYQRFETAGGDICCVHLQTVQFPGVESLRQVFDAVMFYVQNMEISISERLGHITVRDDYDSIESSVYNTRVLSTNQSGTVIESSMVAFPHVFGGDDEPGAILAVDSVDEDELYPYFPSARVRRDISAAIVLTSSRRRAEGAESTGDGELVVTMRRAAFLKLHHPQFPISEDARQEIMAGIAQWGDVMIRTQGAAYSLSSPDPAARKGGYSRKPEKKRKATYLVRKEEKDALQEKLLALKAELAGLKAQTLTPEEAAQVGSLLRRSIAEYGTLRSAVQQQQLGIANIHSMLRLMGSEPQQSSEERFETADGDFCCVRFDRIQFEGVKSIQQVFEALRFYMINMEISISERLGHITVRDDYDRVGDRGFNARVVSTESSGITTETNSVAFTRMFSEENLSCGGVEEPCGVMTCDFVDEDELYPYRGSERVRKDVSGAVVLVPNRAKGDNASQDPSDKNEAPAGELVVTMHRAVFIKLHRPQFAVSETALQDLHEGIARWGDVMLQTVRSIVYATP